MENIQEIKKIELGEDTLRDLDKTRKWSMFLAILGFIAIGLLVIVGLIGGVFLSAFKTGAPLGVAESLILLIIPVFAVIYFFPVLFLFRFSKHAGHGVRAMDNIEIQKAFKYLKRYYVYVGIMVIVVLVIYFIAFIAAGASISFLKDLDLGTGI